MMLFSLALSPALLGRLVAKQAEFNPVRGKSLIPRLIASAQEGPCIES